MWTGLEQLLPHWPRGDRLRELFPDASSVVDDLRLLHCHGLLELRLIEP